MQREEPVSFSNSRGALLTGVLHRPGMGGPSAGVVLCHGMESNKESEKLATLSRLLADRGIAALRFDFSCAAGDDRFAEITYAGEVEDLRGAFEFLLRYIGGGKIALLGSSMGGTVAILFAGRESTVAGLVTVSAPLHPERFTSRLLSPEAVERWRSEGFIIYHGRRINVSLLNDLQALDVPNAAKEISCPALVIHGDSDETVPVAEAYELHALLTGPKRLRIIEGADHRFSRPDLMQIVLEESLDWIIRQL